MKTNKIEQQINQQIDRQTKQDELYQSILNDIRNMYNDSLSETELHKATRNFIRFVKIMMNAEVRKQ